MPKKLQFELSEVVYCVPVPMRQFERLLRREFNDPGIERSTLNQDLEATEGVRGSNYDGHFGPCIYIRIDVDRDSDDVKKKLADIIAEHLARR